MAFSCNRSELMEKLDVSNGLLERLLDRNIITKPGLLAILAKSIAIPITIFCGISIAIAIAIQLLKKYCNTNTNTPSNTNKQSILSGEVRCSLL